MNLQSHKQKLLEEDQKFRNEYYSYDLAFEIGQMMIEARSKFGVTQKQLAEMIKTKQSGIARAESGKYLPSLTFLSKIAAALKAKLIVKFDFMNNFSSDTKTVSTEKILIATGAHSENPNSQIYAYSLNNKWTQSESYNNL